MIGFKDIYKALSRRRGQVSLEVIAVFIPWLLLTLLFFNLVFLLSSLMLVQSAVNRAALQASTVGCLSEGAGDEMSDAIGFGGETEEVYVATTQSYYGQLPKIKPWSNQVERNQYIEPGSSDDSGVPKEGTTRSAWCDTDPVVEYGHVIYVAVAYRQNMALINLPFTGADIDQPRIVRSATVISQLREGVTR